MRKHWSIENELHWVLEVVFNEDHSRVRKDQAPENLAVRRHSALILLKQEKTAKGVMRRNPVGQFQKGLQPEHLALPKIFNIRPAFRSADHRANGDGYHIYQFVFFRPLHSRVGYLTKMLLNRF